MKQYLVISTTALLLLSSCGNSNKDANATLNDKKTALEKLKGDKNKTDAEIHKLEQELAKIDTAAGNTKAKLVSVNPVATRNFEHTVDLQGKIDADNISFVTPRLGPGQVKAIYVTQGQYVKKGQLLLKMDDAVQRQAIAAAKQQTETIKTQLSFAKNIYQRQKNLWDQGIGTEVQLISAKNNVESLENQLKAANEQIKVQTEQLSAADVYSDVNGVADVVSVRVGEIFSGMGQVKIVNTNTLKVVANIPENYISRVHNGSAVIVNVPDLNLNLNATISLIGQAIDPSMRGFVAEAKIPSNSQLKPNQTAILKIKDYAATNVVVIPVNTVQTDEKGKYVFVLDKSGNGKTVARKKNIVIGEVAGEFVEIRSGLAAGEQLITEGYQNLYEGQAITTTVL